MGIIGKNEWVKDGFIQNLPELVKPRLLAAGWTLHAEDEGKQVYIRSKHALKRKRSSFFAMPRLEHIVASMKVTLGYVLSPKRTLIEFVWENGFSVCKVDMGKRLCREVQEWVDAQVAMLCAYLDEWFEAASDSTEMRDQLQGPSEG